MSELLLRVEFHSPEQAHQAIVKQQWPFVKEQTAHGRSLVAEVRLLDDAISDAQRGFLHGVVLEEIHLYARPNGQQFPMPVWKEWFRARLLPNKRVTSINPMTGKKSRRSVRVSTEDLGVRRLAKYIDEVIAIAAEELGVVVSEPMPQHLRPQRRQKKTEVVDQETGEILQ